MGFVNLVMLTTLLVILKLNTLSAIIIYDYHQS